MIKRRFFLISFLLTFGIISLSLMRSGEFEKNPEIEIYLFSNPIHTDLVLPVRMEEKNWNHFLNPEDFDAKAKNSEWIEIGWGDREFYLNVPTWDEFTLGLALDALFTSGPGALHVTYLEGHPKDYANVRIIKISKEKYRKLFENIMEWFILRNKNPILIGDRGYGKMDRFYEAHGSFSLLYTCNVWTSDMLGSVNLPHPLWSPSKLGLEVIWPKLQSK